MNMRNSRRRGGKQSLNLACASPCGDNGIHWTGNMFLC